MKRLLRLSFALTIVLTASWVLYLGGSPGYNRKLLQDERLSQALGAVDRAVKLHVEELGQVPQDLHSLISWCQGELDRACLRSSDGELSGVSLSPAGGHHYEICATFRLAGASTGRVSEFAIHPPGEHCFRRPLPERFLRDSN